MAFLRNLRNALPVDKQEHADLLRRAMEESPTATREIIADALGRTYRTVSNWISPTNPTMPSGEERAALRQLLGPYDSPGDQVERAIMASSLAPWRKTAVISEYLRHREEQARQEGAG